MARGKPKERGTEASTNTLLTALQFITPAAKETGAPFETHCVLTAGFAVATNGVVSMGHPIADDLTACPHTLRLADALVRCPAAYSLTQLENDRLAVRAGAFRAVVPCIAPALAQLPAPDAPCGSIDDRLRTALETVGILAAESAQHVVTASVLLRAGSAVATNRHVIFEAWHGIDLPPDLPIPKSAITALAKTRKKLERFGYSANSFTFYFEGGAWFKTQLYNEAWPRSLDTILNRQANAWPVPDQFWKAVDAVEPFAEENIYFTGTHAQSNENAEVGASYELAGVPAGVIFDPDYLEFIRAHAKTIDFRVPLHEGYALFFFGDNVRGAIMGKGKRP